MVRSAAGHDPDPFAAWLRRELAARGLTQTEFAERMGMTNGAVSHWLAGRKRPDAISRARIAAALGIDPGDVRPAPARGPRLG